MNATSTAIEEFTGQIGFITFFLVSCLLISTFFSEKVLYWFLILVFAGEVLTNGSKLKSLYGKVAG